MPFILRTEKKLLTLAFLGDNVLYFFGFAF